MVSEELNDHLFKRLYLPLCILGSFFISEPYIHELISGLCSIPLIYVYVYMSVLCLLLSTRHY